MHFREYKFLVEISLNFIPKGPIDNNPAPIWGQAVIWTNADPINRNICGTSGRWVDYILN